MRAPDFWEPSQSGLASAALTPISWIYGAITSWRARREPRERAPVPVICIGNLVLGGAGKTLVCESFIDILKKHGYQPHVLLRGYGGSLNGPLRVDPSQHTHFDVGDEALLHAEQAPTWIGKDRIASSQAAVSDGADVLLMDDGFQNPALAKSVSVLIFDGSYGIGNGHVFPAGPLRESLAQGLKRTDAVVILGADLQQIASDAGNLPTFRGTVTSKTDAEDIAGKRVVAFSGIGRPEKFFSSLQDAGADIVHRVAFPDHHAFADPEIEIILSECTERDAIAITTRKDFVRVPVPFRNRVATFDVSISWADNGAIDDLVLSAFEKS